mgnify:CR=1 FL=1
MVTVESVEAHSAAAAAGIAAGDILVSINGHGVRDVLDYRFYMTDTSVRLILTRDGKEYAVKINKGEHDDVGMEFATPLMDKKHTCANKCVFCFIDQMPKGLRKTLYFKDDDDRLSFLHGNYVTLTNLHDEDIDRLLTMHISPVNVSVHTTNPELRVKMMKNKRAGEVLKYLPRLAEGGIALCTQIVLCKNLNDGKELDRTMHDLEKLYPALRSCAIVPVGLTKFREKLYPLEMFNPQEAAKVIAQVDAFGAECKKKHGTRLFYCADELYLKAGLPLPEDDYYEEYSQIQNGVGMITSLETEFRTELKYLDEYTDGFKPPRRVSIVTGVAAYDEIKSVADRLCERVDGLEVTVYKIINHFFGESVTVAGLLTGKDVAEQLAGRDLGDELLFPRVMLRADGDLFLDDTTPAWLSAQLGVPAKPSGGDAPELIHAILGTHPQGE